MFFMRSAVVWAIIGLLSVAGTIAAPEATAQDRSANTPPLNAYRDTIDTFRPPPHELRPFVLSGSEHIILNGTRLDSTEYRIDYRHGRLWVERPHLRPDDELVAIYQTYPFQFEDAYRRRRVADSTEVAVGAPAPVIEEETDTAATGIDPFAGLSLERSGSITRGFVGGSNRDLNVESGLRMQLEGEIAEDVGIRAALTDANTPIQPEGTTQRLSDFDRVFIEIDAPQGTAHLGDVQANFEQSHFGQFARKLQGAVISTADLGSSAPGRVGGSVTAVGATTRGQYRSQDIMPIDGVQGPYRLEGAEGERFIIVIAGSERVYLDGERLTRGETNDYVIDYAQAEITFTSNQIVTEDRRITVEFEYRTTTFDRTLVGTEAQAGFWQRSDGSDRARLGATFLREADSRTFSEIFDLSSADSTLLAQSGDEGAVRGGAERVEFDSEAPYVQYRRTTRSQPDGSVDTVFVALEEAPADSVEVFRVRFTRVGEEQGRYERVGRSVNGILYEYRGEGQGAYEPVQRLPRPVQQRLFDVNGQLEPVPGVRLVGEWARSLNDQNRLSNLDEGDDRGAAYRAGVQLESTPVEWGHTSLGAVSGRVMRERRSAHFTTFNRTRPVEFGRRWNLARRGFDPAEQRTQSETIDEAEVQWTFSPQSTVEASWGRLRLGDAFDGERRAIDLSTDESGAPRLDYQLEYITSEDQRNAVGGAWLRQRGVVGTSVVEGRFTPRLAIEQERRRQTVMGTDSLARTSFSFVEYRPGITYQDGALEASSSVEYRTERDWAAGDLRPSATAWTVQSNLRYTPSSSFRNRLRVGYRVREVTDYFRLNEQREDTESIIIQLNSEAEPLDRAVEIEGFYDALTERTPTLQEIYVRTGPELGQYVWTDSNGDGIIQVDEFVPETTPNEGEYVQRFVPSDSLTPVINVQARLRMRLDPARQWRGADARWKRWLAKATTQTTVEVREKSRESDLAKVYLLNPSSLRQPGRTQDGQLRIEQDVTLFRRIGRYGLDLSFNQVRGLSERAAGRQTRFTNQWQLEGRVRPAPDWSMSVSARTGTDRLGSEAFADARQYNIDQLQLHPEVSYRPSPAWRVTGGIVWGRKRDAVGSRTARVIKLPVEARFSEASRFQVTARGEVAQIDLDGEAVGLAQFELTDGRGPGTSFLWGLDGQYRINDYLRATLSYDGRAPANAPTINTLRMQLSAQF